MKKKRSCKKCENSRKWQLTDRLILMHLGPRAKRAFEQGEREQRVKEKKAAEKKARLLKELEVARVKQF